LRDMAKLGGKGLLPEAVSSLRTAVAERPFDFEAHLLLSLSAWELVAQLTGPGYGCNVCESPIEGARFHCQVCSDYDMCARCHATTVHHHALLDIHDTAKSLKLDCEAEACAGLSCACGIVSNKLPAFLAAENSGVVTQALDMMQRLAIWPEYAVKLLDDCEPVQLLLHCLSEGATAGMQLYCSLFVANCASVAELRPRLTRLYAVGCCDLLRRSHDHVRVNSLARLVANLLLQDANGRQELFTLVPHLREILEGMCAESNYVLAPFDGGGAGVAVAPDAAPLVAVALASCDQDTDVEGGGEGN
jgi:hypothetical protein